MLDDPIGLVVCIYTGLKNVQESSGGTDLAYQGCEEVAEIFWN